MLFQVMIIRVFFGFFVILPTLIAHTVTDRVLNSLYSAFGKHTGCAHISAHGAALSFVAPVQVENCCLDTSSEGNSLKSLEGVVPTKEAFMFHFCEMKFQNFF